MPKLTVDRIEKRECEYRDLWQAVLGRAVRDCFAIEEGINRRARAWLFSPNYETEREIVCDFAGINFDCYREELLGFVKHMENEKRYMECGKREAAKYIAKMLVAHGS